LQGKETGCMTGYHSAAVIAEADAKGFKGIDYVGAYAAMKKRAFVDDYRGLASYRSMGFIPADLEEESVSKTLEYDYDDWAIAHVAGKLGDGENAKLLLERSLNYRHHWDAGTGFLRAKLKDGSWALPFDPIGNGPLQEMARLHRVQRLADHVWRSARCHGLHRPDGRRQGIFGEAGSVVQRAFDAAC
jgi:putative alpha-1,2-mannosidase